MSRSIEQMLPIRELQERRIQADIPLTLFEKADRIRKERRLKWNEVMGILLSKFVDDLGPKTNHELRSQ